jgi:hypothetical protein
MAIFRTFALRTTLGLGRTLAAVAPAPAQDAEPPDGEAPATVPDGNGCAGTIARWQGMAGRENTGGHMDQAVYDQIQNEIDRASHLCEAGQDAQARKLVAQSMRRHGY